MATLLAILSNNWKIKLTCLIAATVLWYLLRANASSYQVPRQFMELEPGLAAHRVPAAQVGVALKD